MYRFRDTLPIDISEQTISGDLVTIANPEEMGVIDSLEVSLSPIQSLNGYSHPWVGGAGKNKLPMTLASLKAVNTATTWSGNTYTRNGITFTVLTDANDNVTGIRANGTATAETIFYQIYNTKLPLASGQYVFNGCPSGGSDTTYRMQLRNGTTWKDELGSGRTFTYDASTSGTDLVRIDILNGAVCNNVVFKPMIRLASESDATYEPYTNICPISGRTEVVTRVAGKNLLPNTATSRTVNGITFTVNSDGSVNINGTATANASLIIATGWQPLKGTYIVSKGASVAQPTVFLDARTSSGFVRTLVLENTGRGVTAIIDYSDYDRFNVGIYVGSGRTIDNVTIYPMIRLASDTDSTYEPYNGNTYTTALGRTVYGGTLDVVSGVLTVDMAMVDLGTLTYSRLGSTVFRFQATLTGSKGSGDNTKAGNIISDIYKTDSWSQVTNINGGTGISINAQGGTIAIQDNNYADASSFKTAMSGHQLCYELATPQTYQLTPQQVTLLVGENHLWSDGEISVVWHKDLTKGRILPTEAVSINGQYIENVLDGYRTLYTKGRESLGAELNTYSVGTADGEKFKSKRYPARELTVGFQLIGDNAEDFREKFNNLNNLLSLDEADFIFHDEEDKFFSGYPIMDAEVEAGQNSVKGEWRIYCAYPFKRSVEPITLTMDDATVTNTTATWAIDYKGAQPARPILRAKFAGAKSGGSSGEDGDCGFVAFMDARENIIQLGNPEVLDLDEYTKAGTLVNKEFVNTSGWTVNGGHSYGGAISGSISTSNTVDAYWNGGKGQTQSYAKPTYGDTGGRVTMHGPTLWKNTAGAVNFTLSAVHRLCVEKSNEYGKFELGAYNHDTGTLVAGFTITKTSNGTTGTVRYIANGEVVGTDKIDLSYNNTHFGYCKRSEVYTTQTYKERAWVKVQVPIGRNKYQTKSQLQWVNKTRQVFSGYTYTQSNLNSSIQKAGAYVYFQVGNLPKRTFNVPDIEQMVAHDASCHMCAYKTAMHTNMVHSIVFRRQAVTAFAEQPNVFTAGDIVEADCNEATVNIYHAGSMGGHLEPQYGALGNDWENFILTSGANVIQATWSDWVNPTYKPQIEIEYNEVYI